MSTRILTNKNVIRHGVDDKEFIQTVNTKHKRKQYVQYLAMNTENPNRFLRRQMKKYKINE